MPKKPKISDSEAMEVMAIIYKISGKRVTEFPNPEEKLFSVHKILTDYAEKKAKTLPKIHF